MADMPFEACSRALVESNDGFRFVDFCPQARAKKMPRAGEGEAGGGREEREERE